MFFVALEQHLSGPVQLQETLYCLVPGTLQGCCSEEGFLLLPPVMNSALILTDLGPCDTLASGFSDCSFISAVNSHFIAA